MWWGYEFSGEKEKEVAGASIRVEGLLPCDVWWNDSHSCMALKEEEAVGI